MHFNKGGGNLGNSGAVAFMFDRMGVFRVKPDAIGDRDDFLLEMIDYGLDSILDDTDAVIRSPKSSNLSDRDANTWRTRLR